MSSRPATEATGGLLSDTSGLGEALLTRARNAIAQDLHCPVVEEPEHPSLMQPGASFVTLTQGDELRGCIGTLEAHRSLDADVRSNARAAAFRDPRFMPLLAEELPATRVEVSLLGIPQELIWIDEEDALAQLRPYTDGIIFEYQNFRSTFLPQVWESLPDPRQFLAQLKRKAGLPSDFWAPGIRLQRYEVTKWKENPPQPQKP